MSEYDLSGFRPVHFEFERKTQQVVNAVKERARARGIPYQRFIREAVEKALEGR